jgi:hypothetical protein
VPGDSGFFLTLLALLEITRYTSQAIVGLAWTIMFFVPCLGPFFSMAAMITGMISLEKEQRRSIAISGILLGLSGTFGLLFLFILVVIQISWGADYAMTGKSGRKIDYTEGRSLESPPRLPSPRSTSVRLELFINSTRSSPFISGKNPTVISPPPPLPCRV